MRKLFGLAETRPVAYVFSLLGITIVVSAVFLTTLYFVSGWLQSLPKETQGNIIGCFIVTVIIGLFTFGIVESLRNDHYFNNRKKK